jgi:RNA polymerase sigma-70 factor (ECF subfamily)
MKGKISEAAFVEAYDLYADEIFRYCYFRIRDRDRARDLMQETFTKTWAYLAAGNKIENLRAFLYRVAHNASVDEAMRPKAQSLEVLKETAGYDPADEGLPSPSEAAEHSLLLRQLEKLDDASRETLTLRYMNGLPVKEIATLRGEEPNSVSVRIHRALKTLKEMMQ